MLQQLEQASDRLLAQHFGSDTLTNNQDSIAWTLLYWGELRKGPVPDVPAVRQLRQNLYNHARHNLIGSEAANLDTSAVAMMALGLNPRVCRRMLNHAVPALFNGKYFETVYHESAPTVTTNIHVLAALPTTPYAHRTMLWLESQINRHGGIVCKSHVSPVYATGELARQFSRMQYPKAQKLAARAVAYLLDCQRADGGWGVEKATHEETGCAILAIRAACDSRLIERDSMYHAFRRAYGFLRDEPNAYTPLWNGEARYCMRPVATILHQVAQQMVELELEYHDKPRFHFIS